VRWNVNRSVGRCPVLGGITTTVQVSDLERVRAADLGDRITVVDVPDPRAADIGNSLESAAFTEDAVWIVSHRGGIVSRIDPVTNAVVAVIESPILPGCIPNACVGLGSIAASGTHVWFHNGYSESFERVDPTTNEVVGSRSAAGFRGLLAADGLIWSGATLGAGAIGMDPASGDVTVTVDEGQGLYPASFAAGSVWFVGADCTELRRIDPATGATQATIEIESCVGDLIEVGDEVWAGTYRGILRLDPVLNQPFGLIRIRTENERFSLAVDGDSVWFRGKVTELLRIDPTTRQPVERIGLPGAQYQAAMGVAGGALWVANWGEGTMYRIDGR